MVAKIRTVFALLSPSMLSALCVITLGVGFVAQKSWAYINHKRLFYDFLFSSDGARAVLLTHPGQPLTSNTFVYTVFVVVCAVLVGLAVYFGLTAASGAAKNSRNALYELRSKNSTYRAMLAASVRSGAVRALAALGWLAYVIGFVALLTPVCITLTQTGIDRLSSSETFSGWFFVVFAGILFAFSLHLHVTFLRLIFLRARLFGGLDSDLYLSER
jgi:hypothetical protein